MVIVAEPEGEHGDAPVAEFGQVRRGRSGAPQVVDPDERDARDPRGVGDHDWDVALERGSTLGWPSGRA